MADTVRCAECKHYRADMPELRGDDERESPDIGHLGSCVALDPATLPYAWRYCPRERTGVWSLATIVCPRFEALDHG